MSRAWVCRRGHRWDGDDFDDADGPPACLVCGGACAAVEAPSHATDGPATDVTDEHLPAADLPRPEGGRPAGYPVIPGYRVSGRLGRGGMGDVYRAVQAATGRIVALKLPRGEGGAVEAVRFRAEAEAAARLLHPNIVQLFEVGEGTAGPFLVMEYCPGGSLADRLDGTPLAPREAAELLDPVARAVHAAHAAGIVHRDLKPANILFGAGGGSGSTITSLGSTRADHDPPSALTPKVADFGLARRIDDDSGLTRTGAVMGTPSYMAPEQAAGATKSVGPTADVYALGAVLYELLVGRPPFRGATPLDTLDQIRTQDPVPPRRLQPKVPRDLETICLKALRKEPARRYASALDLADDLRRFLGGRPVVARPVGPAERLGKWARRRPTTAALLGLLLAGLVSGAVGAAAYQRHVERQRDRAVAHLRLAMRSIDEMLTEVAEEDLAGEPRMEPKRRALLERALVLYTELLQVEGDDLLLHEQLALASKRVGDINRLLGRHPEAEAAYRRALGELDGLRHAAPDRPDLALHAAECHTFLGELHRIQSRPDEAADCYRTARAVQQQLHDADPAAPAYRQDLARSHYNLGIVDKDRGRLDDARRELERAVALLRETGPEAAGNAGRRHHLARSLLNLGTVLRLEAEGRPPGDLVAARAAFADSIRLFEGLTAEFPDRPNLRHELAAGLLNAANLGRRSPDPAQNLEPLTRALALLRRLAADFPATPEYRRTLANACNSMAALAFSRGDVKDAETALAESADHYRELIARGGVTEDHAGRGEALGNLARLRLRELPPPGPAAAVAGPIAVAADAPRADGVRTLLVEAVRDVCVGLRAKPNDADLQRSLRSRCFDLARLLARDLDTAAAVRLAGVIAGDVPDHPIGVFNAVCLLGRFAQFAPTETPPCADRAFDLLQVTPAASHPELRRLLADPAIVTFRGDERIAKWLVPSSP